MSGPWLPGYDAWKLATPPEYEDPPDEPCPMCGGAGILEEDEDCDSETEGAPECPECCGEGWRSPP
jgi:hypothetical protein